MKYALLTAAVAGMAIGAAGARGADTTVTGGFMPGHGDPQNNFTVATTTDGTVELGLSAQQRFTAPFVSDDNAGTYFAVVGGHGIGSLWNFDFSIATTDGTSLSSKNLTYSIDVTSSNSDFSAEINPLFLPDNYPGGSAVPGSLGVGQEVQNSENLNFGDLNLAHTSGLFTSHTGTFDFNEAENYTFTLTARDAAHQVVATDSITVDVVPTPLPSAAGMGLAVVGGLGVMGLLRKRASAV
ncbi:MAG TPA: hypothetical protein VH253_07990 [Phycisphaerae bacterium]|nr:hypothetical protein [Phycisphaerae bacterium]